MSSKVNIDDLAEEIIRTLQDYSDDITTEVKQSARIVALAVKEELQETSPKDTKYYAEHWKSSVTEDKTEHTINISVRDKKYQISHLLEHGHALRRGGRTIGDGFVNPKPHIFEAQEHGEKLFDELIRKAIS